MFEVLSIASAATVFISLGYIAFRMPALLVKPSTLFLVFFCLQVQISAAINAKPIADSLADPWIFFLLVQIFPLACLGIVFLFQKNAAERLFVRVGALVGTLPVLRVAMAAVLLLIVEYSVVAVYLSNVPLAKTGLYAALFEPEMHDSYRELSLKLLLSKSLGYLFTIQEKVIAPVTGAACVLLFGLAWRAGRRFLALAAAVGILLAVLPAMLSGARGPGAMVVLAALFAWFLAFARRFTVGGLALALLLILLPPIAIMLAKSQTLAPQAVAFQTLNVFDRVIGRGYIDNVWHLKWTEENGIYGIGAIEKFAPIFKVKGVDAFREVAAKHKDQGGSFGLKVLEMDAPAAPLPAPKVLKMDAPAAPLPVRKVREMDASAASPNAPQGGVATRSIAEAIPCDPHRNADCVDVTKSASAGASFVVMNYAIFGWAGVGLSLAFVFAMDILLWLYKRIDDVMLVPAIAASAVPTLTLSFSLFTTVLASKGLLLIPLFCLGLGWVLVRMRTPETTRC